MLTSGSLSEIVFPETRDYDKKLYFDQSISYLSDAGTMKGFERFRLPKQIFQKSCLFNEIATGE